MNSPIYLFLPEFSPQGLGPEPVPETLVAMTDFGDVEDPAPAKAEDLLSEARAQGFAEGSASLEAALAAQADELEASHASDLEAVRRQWVTEAADLAARVGSALEGVEERLADGVAAVLEPFIEAELRRKAVRELRQAVASLIANGHGTTIRVSGPEDLVEPLRLAFEDRASIEIATTAGPEIDIEADSTLIRTQLQVWATTLKSHLEETL